MTYAELRSAAACKEASNAPGLIPWMFDPDIDAGYDATMTEYFHVIAGLAGHLRDFLLSVRYHHLFAFGVH